MAGLNSSLHHPVRIVIVGGGYVGMYTALGLQKKLSRGAADITVTEPQSNMTYQPFLPEAAAAHGTPRSLDEPSRAAVEAALAAAHGVVSRAAQALGMSRQALYRRMERYAIPPGS